MVEISILNKSPFGEKWIEFVIMPKANQRSEKQSLYG
jgi:hypothetical protein